MKKLLVILWLQMTILTALVPRSDVQELQKVSKLAWHYAEERSHGHFYHFSDFIFDHYQNNHAQDPAHDQLPFHQLSANFMPFTVQESGNSLSIFISTKLIRSSWMYEASLRESYPKALFQPPRAAFG